MFERGHIITGNNAEPQFTLKGGIKSLQCNINARSVILALLTNGVLDIGLSPAKSVFPPG